MLSIQWNNLKKQNSLKIVQHHHEGNKLHKMFRVETGLGGDCWWTWEAWSGAEVEGPGAEGPGRAGAAVDTPPGPSPPAAGARQREDAAEAGWLLCRAARGHDEGELFPGSLSSPIRGNGRQSSLHGRPPFTPSSQILSGGCVWGTRLSALRASIIGQCASQAWPTPQMLAGWEVLSQCLPHCLVWLPWVLNWFLFQINSVLFFLQEKLLDIDQYQSVVLKVLYFTCFFLIEI